MYFFLIFLKKSLDIIKKECYTIPIKSKDGLLIKTKQKRIKQDDKIESYF